MKERGIGETNNIMRISGRRQARKGKEEEEDLVLRCRTLHATCLVTERPPRVQQRRTIRRIRRKVGEGSGLRRVGQRRLVSWEKEKRVGRKVGGVEERG